MPSIPRAHCRDAQDLQLWIECHAAEDRATRLLELVRWLAHAAEGLGDVYETLTLQDVTPHAERAVMSAGAARARCFRRNFSNAARRQAVDDAKRLGALPEGFDERSLPWKQEDVPNEVPPPKKRERKIPIEEQLEEIRASDPMTAASLADAARRLPLMGRRTRDILLMGRLAQLEDAPKPVCDAIARAWTLSERLGAEVQYGQRYDSGERATDGARFLFPNGQVAWSDSGAKYPDGSQATSEDVWHYPSGSVARDGDRFYRPSAGSVPDVSEPRGLRRFRKEVLRRATTALDASRVERLKEGLDLLPEDLVPLALLEIQQEAELVEMDKSRHAKPTAGRKKER